MEERPKLDGEWFNDYGSRMELSVAHGLVSGTYFSMEGDDIGRFRVTGLVDEHPGGDGLTVGLIVSWRDLDSTSKAISSDSPNQEAASSHWMTSLIGQLHAIDGHEILSTTFLLTKNTSAENRWEDTVVNTMVFRRDASGFPRS